MRYILTIAATERTMLYRIAKFWVLAGIGVLFILFFLVVMAVATFMDDSIPGEFLLQGTDAYLALYFFSYLQVIIIIFVAADFRKAEEKARLDQVMMSQPMTTTSWVLGKYFGVVSAILYLNLFLILLATIGRIIKAIFLGTGFNILPFLEYFGLVTLPSIFFMTALVFFLASLVRAQSIAIVLSLGYVASILFYFHHKFLGLFDYAAFFAPLFASDFIGFGDIDAVLWQRLLFLLLAGALIGFSVLLYPRLWQSSISKNISRITSLIFLATAGFLILNIIQKHRSKLDERAVNLEFQKTLAGQTAFAVTHYDFQIRFGGEKDPLDVTAKMILANPNAAPLERLIFGLNNELRVSQVKGQNGRPLPFQQKHHALIVDLDGMELQSNAVDSIEIVYAGGVDADAFMLDRLPEAEGIVDKSDGPWTQGNISAWLDSDYAVLPAESGWYPTTVLVGGYEYPNSPQKNYASATLAIEMDKKLTAITQGRPSEDEIHGLRKKAEFVVTDPVPGFSLNVGQYKHLTHEFSQTKVDLYVHPKHLLDYDLFSDVADTCLEAVESMLGVLERVAGVPYPYPKLALVEVPLQMQIYPGRFGVNNILQQPSVVMIDEVTIASQRIKKEIDEKTKRARKRGRDDSPSRIKRDVFVEMVLDLFFNERFWRGDGSLRAPLRNYINFQVDLRDPLLDRAIELQLYEETEREVRDLFYPDRWNAQLSSYDRMRQNEWGGWTVRRRYGIEIDSLLAVLTRTPLAKIQPDEDGNLFRACVDFKAPPILQMLSQRIGEKNYSQAMQKLVEQFRGQAVSRADFLRLVQSFSNEDVLGFFSQWFDQATFPGYRITHASAEKFDTGKMNILYQVTTRVQNGEEGDGFVRLVCETKNDKIRRNLALASFEEKQVHLTTDEEPKRVTLIPYFSRNRGTILKEVSVSNRIRRGTPQDTVYSVSLATDSTFFVLDDQDKGFFTPVSSDSKYLRPPSKGSSWWQYTNPFAYGKYYFGWRVRRAGDGDYPARWETSVPRAGEYELGFYFRVGRSWVRRNMSRRFHVNIVSADGSFPVQFEPQETSDGWVPLGRFNFVKEKPAVVELADTGTGYLVADAIRWEFVQ